MVSFCEALLGIIAMVSAGAVVSIAHATSAPLRRRHCKISEKPHMDLKTLISGQGSVPARRLDDLEATEIEEILGGMGDRVFRSRDIVALFDLHPEEVGHIHRYLARRRRIMRG